MEEFWIGAVCGVVGTLLVVALALILIQYYLEYEARKEGY